jgi:TatD DNase family protein
MELHLTDTHTHLYLPQYTPDLPAVIERAQQDNVQQVYFPAIDSTTHEAMITVAEQYPEYCKLMMGVHPCSVNASYRQELDIAFEWLSKKPFAAIGEIGLDHHWDTTFAQEQADAFAAQMQWALDKDLPINIHTRNATQLTIEAVKPFARKGLRGIFHCFSGSAETAAQIIRMGFMLGIGGVVTYKNAGVAEAIRDVPLEYLVLETDAPYLTPVPHRGKRNESSYIKYVVQKIADVKQLSVEEVAHHTTENAGRIFAF